MSLTVTIAQFSGGVTEVVPSAQLTACANYLYELLDRWAFPAGAIVDGGNGGAVAPITPVSNIFPFVITSPDFESDGVSYNNPDIVGVNLLIFINEVSQTFMVASDTTFRYTATGIEILVPGFDAYTYDYTITIQKLGSG